ncbi:site-specific DNA-methyltransferase [uncultured Parabacteroides sp.]|uniref:site-specific DNA-methyltransferase n=1 Tax=uncultured Parabacteroides sp. TaxID=512312 RepID=UPI002592C2AC|nr:site-specific DNA-methyltransferase [uncultured Parabacteroides sp.]
MDGYSQTPQKERLETLRLLMPEVFDEGHIDWEKLKAALGENVNFANERYVLNWAGKSEAFRVMQQPSTATLVPCREESVDFDNTQNVFIEGENMEVLKVLQRSYFRKVKMIYIDPPYNTGSDSFIYPDKFSESKEEYLRRVGDKNEEGYMTRDGMFRKNAKENGQYHSNWLNMMMPRLYLAKSLLREDGVIFISIDDNEVHNLRLLMNEIFGEENFVAQLIWERAYAPKNDAKYISNSHDYILMYSKQIENFKIGRLARTEEANSRYSNPDNDPRGVWKPSDLSVKTYTPDNDYPITTPSGRIVEPPAGRCWSLSRNSFRERLQDNRIWFGAEGDSVPCIKRFLTELKFEGMAPTSILFYKEVGHSQEGAKEVTKLLDAGAFDSPKPVRLLKRLLTLANLDKDSIIFDFFAGSGTTAHAVMQLNEEDKSNRKFICVQLPELCEEKSEAYKAGYKTIAEISKERIRRAGTKIRKEIEMEQAKQKGQLSFDEEQTVTMPDLGVKIFKLSDSNFKQWRDIKGSDKEEWQQQILDFLDPVTENATIDNMVYELLLKSGKDLNSVIEQKEDYYLINGNELILMLESATQDVVNSVLAEHPDKVIALDRLFEGNDQLKTNTVLQMRDAGIEFKTI